MDVGLRKLLQKKRQRQYQEETMNRTVATVNMTKSRRTIQDVINKGEKKHSTTLTAKLMKNLRANDVYNTINGPKRAGTSNGSRRKS